MNAASNATWRARRIWHWRSAGTGFGSCRLACWRAIIIPPSTHPQRLDRCFGHHLPFLRRRNMNSTAASVGAALCDCTLPDERCKHFEALAAHYRQLEVWAANCPENFENRAALVGAEIARLEGRELDAEHLYEKAIRSAHANGFVHNAALANELAGRFYAARGFEKIAKAYLQDARYGYLRWGANGKVKQLDHLYPHLGEEAPAPGPTNTTVAPVEPLVYPRLKNEPDPGPTSTIVAPVELLDLSTVIKVSQAVSGEMVLEKLIDRLMRAAIEHAGAER